jgi:predicted PurR-regulated permease PerM
MNTSTVIIVICIYTGVQIIQSGVTQPLIQQKMISIPPALIVIGQVAMGALDGFWGVLLAMPIVAILMKIINELYVKPQLNHKYKVKSTGG